MAPWVRPLLVCILIVVSVRFARMLYFRRWMGADLRFKFAADHPWMFRFLVAAHGALLVTIILLLLRNW
jgi:hypothetical protein